MLMPKFFSCLSLIAVASCGLVSACGLSSCDFATQMSNATSGPPCRNRRNAMMSVEVDEIAKQSSALVHFLTGTWTTKLTAYAHSDLSGIGMHLRLGEATGRCFFQALPDGEIAAHYVSIQDSGGVDESTADGFLQLKLNATDNELIAYFGNDKSIPGIKGIWCNSGLRFRSDFHDGITMWEVFPEEWRQVLARPSNVSLVIRRMCESSWLFDVAFVFKESEPPQGTLVVCQCRLEFWHLRQRLVPCQVLIFG